MRSTKSRDLAIPPRAEILAKALEPEELAQGEKMFGKARARLVYFRLFQELAPGLVREKGERAKLPAFFQMREYFSGDAFLLFDRRIFRSLRAVLDERFLGICRFTMHQSHEGDELIPGLPVHVTIPARVNRGEFPLVFAGKRIDRLSQRGSQSFYFSGRALGSTGLPQVGPQIQLLHAQTIALADACLKLFRSRKIVKLRKMA